ncbi:hypothetical protein OAP63_14340 [Vibrio sp.]|nr:hypothetical protein [Vibrio sp.]
MADLKNSRDAIQHNLDLGSSRSFERVFSVEDLSSQQKIACSFGSNGRVFVIPLTDGLPVNAIGSIKMTVDLAGVEEDIPNGTVMLSQCIPPTYSKPSWGGLADSLRLIVDSAISGCDSVKVIVERY